MHEAVWLGPFLVGAGSTKTNTKHHPPFPPLPTKKNKKHTQEILSEVSGMQWGAFKPLLADAVVAHLEPIQRKYNEVCGWGCRVCWCTIP